MKAINSKRELLKLNYGSKKNLKEDSKRYESEKKKESKEKIVKSKSNVKLEMKPQLEKLKIREISIGKMQSHTDEFSDKRMAEAS